MDDYSREVAAGGNAASMLKHMMPKPVKAVEDPNAMAVFIEDMSNKASQVQVEESPQNFNTELIESSNDASDGADFAAQFALEIDQ